MPSHESPKNHSAIPTLCSIAHTAAPSIRHGSPTSTWQIVLHLRTRRAKLAPRCCTTAPKRLRLDRSAAFPFDADDRHSWRRGSIASREVRGRFLCTRRSHRRSSRLGAHALLGSACTLLLIDRILPVRSSLPLFLLPLPARSGHPVQNEASCILPTVPCHRDGSPRFGACAKIIRARLPLHPSQSEHRLDSGEARHTNVVGGAISEVISAITPTPDARDDEREAARRRLRDGRPAPTLMIF